MVGLKLSGFLCYRRFHVVAPYLKNATAGMAIVVVFSVSTQAAAPPGSLLPPINLFLLNSSCNAVASMVVDTNGFGFANPQHLTKFNDKLFFTTNHDSLGTELWKSDGTPGGTMLVKDINPSTGHSSPAHLTDVNGTLFFQASDVANNPELWKSDGTDARNCKSKRNQS